MRQQAFRLCSRSSRNIDFLYILASLSTAFKPQFSSRLSQLSTSAVCILISYNIYIGGQLFNIYSIILCVINTRASAKAVPCKFLILVS